MSRVSWHLPAAAVLLILLAALGTLQYRWLGDVSEAERERMRSGLRTRASDFSDAVNRELTRIYLAFQVEGRQLAERPDRTMADAWTRWKASSAAPSVVDAVYLLAPDDRSEATLRKLDPERGTLAPAPWIPALEKWRVRNVEIQAAGVPMPVLPDAIDASIPALIIHTPFVTHVGAADRIEYKALTGGVTRAVIVVLNAEALRRQVVAPLVARYFAAEYVVTIVRRDDPKQVVYTSESQPPLAASSADVTTGLFDLRLDELARFNLPNAPAESSRALGVTATKMAITVVRRGQGGPLGRMLVGGPDAPGAWQARVRYASGPLDAIVAGSRRRNLAIGLGVLGLLGASFVLIVASAQRQQRLARQQIEFVAAVSHELRTPLAVIRSAGENLSDGLVSGDEAVKRYGALISSEGRRLSDMVERVMGFAGMTSGTTARGRAEVGTARVIGAAAAGARIEARERGIEVVVHAPASLPPIVGDADALQSALENVIGNAVKYSNGGSRVDVTATVDRGRLRIAIADRGIGIDADELSQIFKPFFRGRRAADAQIRGAGIGLAVVRHAVDAHGGDIRVESRAGEGTTVTIELPVGDRVESPAAMAAPRDASA